MIQVKWNYPTPTYNNFIPGVKTQSDNSPNNGPGSSGITVDPAFLSFDYTMSYSIFRKKPEWLPTRIYDDGARTYIQLDETVLHTESPVLFNNRNEKVNYRVSANLIIIDQLIQKVTIKLGKDSVTIEKKRTK
jgi:type IV secretion system protein VirB9